MLEERLDNMSMVSSGKDNLDEKNEAKKDEVKKEVSWSDNPSTQRRHAIIKSKPERKN